MHHQIINIARYFHKKNFKRCLVSKLKLLKFSLLTLQLLILKKLRKTKI